MTGARLKEAAATRYRPAEVTAGRRRYQPRPDRQNPQSKEATMPTNSTAQLLTIEQLAEQLTTSIRHIRRLIAERRIPYIKVGHLVRFDPTEIDEWIDRHRVGGRRPPTPAVGAGR
jgi:excisionase family DNA binding protein